MYGVGQDGNVTTVLLTLSNPITPPQPAAGTTTNNNNSKPSDTFMLEIAAPLPTSA